MNKIIKDINKEYNVGIKEHKLPRNIISRYFYKNKKILIDLSKIDFNIYNFPEEIEVFFTKKELLRAILLHEVGHLKDSSLNSKAIELTRLKNEALGTTNNKDFKEVILKINNLLLSIEEDANNFMLNEEKSILADFIASEYINSLKGYKKYKILKNDKNLNKKYNELFKPLKQIFIENNISYDIIDIGKHKEYYFNKKDFDRVKQILDENCIGYSKKNKVFIINEIGVLNYDE